MGTTTAVPILSKKLVSPPSAEISSLTVAEPGQTLPLKDILWTALSESQRKYMLQNSLSSEMFSKPDPPSATPTLRRGVVNRILLYTGSFHPPHVSHRAVLCDGFFHSGADLNLVGAIVHPWEEVNTIFDCNNRRTRLSKLERRNLWLGADTSDEDVPPIATWACVDIFSTDDLIPWLRKIKLDGERSGFEIEFVRLMGADHVRLDNAPIFSQYECKKYIVSDAGRNADFVDDGLELHSDSDVIFRNELFALSLYSRWHPVSYDETELRRLACHEIGASHLTATVRSASEGVIRCQLKVWKLELSCLKECNGHVGGLTIRYVPRTQPLPEPAVSSTRIRSIVAWTELSQLKTRLEGIALNHVELARLICATAGVTFKTTTMKTEDEHCSTIAGNDGKIHSTNRQDALTADTASKHPVSTKSSTLKRKFESIDPAEAPKQHTNPPQPRRKGVQTLTRHLASVSIQADEPELQAPRAPKRKTTAQIKATRRKREGMGIYRYH